jgi:hypothetical protein
MPLHYLISSMLGLLHNPSHDTGQKLIVPVTTCRDALVLTSPTAGEYIIPIVGRCTAPKPQGPIELVKGAGSVPFRNIFAKAAEFVYRVDNPAFVVKPSETVPAKKAIDVAVSYKGEAGKSAVARLTISCPAEQCPPWVFYLRA